MGNKKNIDKLFQEQFKNFEAVPSDAMWGAIQSKLDENSSNKKRIPIWVVLSSVAAALMVFIALSISLSSVNESEEKVVLTSESKELLSQDKYASEEKEGRVLLPLNNESGNIVDFGLNNYNYNYNYNYNNNNIVFINSKNEKAGLIQESGNVLRNVVVADVKSKVSSFNPNEKQDKLQQAKGSNILKIDGGLSQRNSDKIAFGNTKTIGSNNGEYVKGNSRNDSDLKKRGLSSNEELVVANEKSGAQYVVGNISESSVTNNKSHEVLAKNTNEIDINVVEGNSTITSNDLQDKSLTNIPNIKSDNILVKVEDNVNSNKDVAELETVSNSENLDLSKGAISQEEECVDEEVENPIEKTIEEAIAELEEKQDDENNKEDEEIAFNKWKIAPNIAPVYYNTLSSGSPINSELSGNKKKGKINMSYGLGVGYAINKKLTLRTGINKISLGFDTEDVAVNTNSEAVGGTRGMKNINLSPAAASLNIASSESFSIAQIPSSFSSLYNSSLNQRLGYLEVPLELSYKISDKKMKIDVIAGMSTFFLNENDIYTETNGVETHIGEANNLNKMSYSTNIGLGFNYNISKAFNFNFEPTFKYQLNAFSNDSGNFKPYILGVYTGFSFKF